MKIGKFFCFLSLTLISHKTLANENGLSSLSFKVKDNELFSNFNIKSYYFNKIDPQLGNSKVKMNYQAASLNLEYGINDQLSFSAIAELPLRSKMKLNGADFDYKYKGISDIALRANYRFMDEDNKGDFIFGLNYSDKLEQNSAPPMRVDYNTGGPSLVIASKFSGIDGVKEWSISPGILFNLEKKVVTKDDVSQTRTTSTFKPSVTFNIAGEGQYNLLDDLSIGFGGDFKFNGKKESKTSQEGTKAYVSLDLYTYVKYLINPDVMIAVNYFNSIPGDTKNLTGELNSKDAVTRIIGFAVSTKF